MANTGRTNLGDIIKNLRKSIDDVENALNTRTIREVVVEDGFNPFFDRTEIYLWITFTDDTTATLPIGWYQGEPFIEDTKEYADGKISCVMDA